MSRVEIYLYDLSRGMARQLSPMLLGRQIDGVWHTGVVVFGIEYFYGGGIVAARAGTAITDMRYEVIQLGQTNKTKAELEHFLRSIAHRFTAETYELLRHNCNNFSDEICRFLLNGAGIPQFILSLPGEVLNTPIGQMIAGFESQLRNRSRGNSPLNPFGHAAPEPAAAGAAPAAAAAPTAAAAAAPKLVEFGVSEEQLKLALARLSIPAVSDFFANVNWKTSPLSPSVELFWTPLFRSGLLLQIACVLRHICLNVKLVIPEEKLHNWLNTTNVAVQSDSIDNPTKVMLLIALVNLVSRLKTVPADVLHVALHLLADLHVPVRRAVGKLMLNIFVLLLADSDDFALAVTTVLTRLEEETDAGVTAELLQALMAAKTTKPTAFAGLVTDVLGKGVCAEHVASSVRTDPKITDLVAKFAHT